MTKKTYWHADNTPVETTIDRILYDIRKDDKEGLIFDSISINDIIEDSDGVLALDALITHYAKLEAKMNALQKVMERSGTDVKPVNLTISEPFMRNGVANVAAVFELSDGQGVTIFFHNPDVTPKKMMPTDELISWKWLLNKKDITIVVAPEKGVDLNIRQVAVRIMKLAQKNSAAFLRVNAKSAERKKVIDDLKTEISDLETELKQAQNRLEVAKVEKDEREIAAIDNPTPESVEPETTTEIVSPKNKVTLLWSEASEIENKDFESLNELQQFMRDEYKNDASEIPTSGYDKHKFNVGKFNGIRIDVGGNDGNFNPFKDNLSKYLKNENYDVEIEPDLSNSVGDENSSTETTEIIEPTGDENSPIEATLNGFSVSETTEELNYEYSTDNDVWNASVEEVQALSNDDYEKLIDALENANYHNYYNAVKALRKGDKALANEFNTLQKKQENAGHLTPELRDKRAELVDKLESVELGDNTPTETESSEENNDMEKTTGKIESIDKLIDIARNSGDNKAFVEIGKVSPEVAEKVKEVTGIDVDGFVHSIDEAAIRHIFKQHGNEKTEKSRGQIGVTDEDIKNIKEIVENPDEIQKGEVLADGIKTVIYKKTIDGKSIYVQEVRKGRGRLAAKTLWKVPVVPPTAPDESDGLAHTSETSNTHFSQGNENIPQPPENTIAEIDAEIESLKSETDYKVFDKRLDDLAAKVEAAGLMEEYEPKLNDVADFLTVLLAKAEKELNFLP